MSLHYQELPPSPPLGMHVECIWTLEGELEWATGPDRVVPDGRTELIWNLADRFKRYENDLGPRRQETALLVGQITRPIYLAPGQRVSLVAVRFRPAALGSFLRGMAAAELTDLDIPLEDVLGRRLRNVGELLADQPAGEARVRALEAAIAADLARAIPIDVSVAAAVDLIVSSRGRVRIERLAELTGMSRRHLERRFHAAVGIGPKRLARIVRFHHLLTRLDELDPRGWGGLAVSCGYYDQAHLIHDFREFAACTPGEYLTTDSPLGWLFLED